MSKRHKKIHPAVVGAPDLLAQSQRVLAAGRAVLGADIVDGDQALATARAVAERLADLAPDVRLAAHRNLVSLTDDLIQLNDRLRAEKTRVEQRLLLRSRHAAAGRAYRTGERQ